MTRYLVAVTLCLPLAARAQYVPTTTSLSDIDKSALATCGAGFTQTTSSNLSLALGKAGGLSGGLDGQFKQDARAAILADDTFPQADRLKAFEDFLGCLRTFQSTPKK
jgi:hypothetical protein